MKGKAFVILDTDTGLAKIMHCVHGNNVMHCFYHISVLPPCNNMQLHL